MDVTGIRSIGTILWFVNHVPIGMRVGECLFHPAMPVLGIQWRAPHGKRRH
jgi:hypothetical protein